MAKGTCPIDDCGRPATHRDWCLKHYKRWRKTGDPNEVSFIRGDDRARFESRADRSGGPDACHPFNGPRDEGGYCHIRIGGDVRPAHAVAWELEHGPIQVDPVLGRRFDIDHECHNRAVLEGSCVAGVCAHRTCVNVRHLGMKPRTEHRRDTPPYARAQGSAHGNAKLTEAQIPLIRAALAAGTTGIVVAGQFGVSKAVIFQIKNGRSWRHVP